MNKICRFLFKLIIFIISLTLTDGGRIIALHNADLHYNAVGENNNDIELADLINFSALTDCDKWMRESDVNTVPVKLISEKIIFASAIKSQDFIFSIWQPPRF